MMEKRDDQSIFNQLLRYICSCLLLSALGCSCLLLAALVCSWLLLSALVHCSCLLLSTVVYSCLHVSVPVFSWLFVSALVCSCPSWWRKRQSMYLQPIVTVPNHRNCIPHFKYYAPHLLSKYDQWFFNPLFRDFPTIPLPFSHFSTTTIVFLPRFLFCCEQCRYLNCDYDTEARQHLNRLNFK
jgi:hypothetical protein